MKWIDIESNIKAKNHLRTSVVWGTATGFKHAGVEIIILLSFYLLINLFHIFIIFFSYFLFYAGVEYIILIYLWS